MKRLIYYLPNRLWVSLCKSEYKKFMKSLGNVKQVQQSVLTSIIRDNSHSAYGIEFNFNEIKSTEEFRKKVPLTAYEDYCQYIDRIKAGEASVLTVEPIVMLELSSGSTSS